MSRVDHILKLLGADEAKGRTPCLIPIPAKQKGPVMPGWNEVTWERMQDEDYRAQLEASPNLGVILGKQSGPLATVDIDVEEYVGPFLEANPRLRQCLRTRGAKGCQIWAWLKPDPKLVGLGLPNWQRGFPDQRFNIPHRVVTQPMADGNGGTKEVPLVVMEWRAGATQSVIQGIHPSGNEYRVVVEAPPAEISFRDIIWPEYLKAPWRDDLFKAVEALAGDPFTTTSDGLSLAHHFWAAHYALIHDVVFEPDESRFYAYNPVTGGWEGRIEAQMFTEISRDLLRLGRDLPGQAGQLLAGSTGRSIKSVSAIASFLQGEVAKPRVFEREPGVIHLENGMLDVRTNPPFLDSFSPNYFSRNQVRHNYAPGAPCPLWKDKLLADALDADDQVLLQKLAGMCLLGNNLLQRIVILTGNAGAGKSQIAQVIQGIIGRHNVAQLRTEHLDERFEAEGFIGKTLLVGSDVPGSFLNRASAAQLKSLTGGDYLQAEIKGGRRVDITGNFNVIITCNSRLVVKTDEDSGAWRRRLVILAFNRPPPVEKIPDLAKLILATEASGVLDWMIEGARMVLHDVEAHGRLVMAPAQAQRIEALLNESESVRHYVETALEVVDKEQGITTTRDELLEGYREFCAARGWNALADTTFLNQLRDLVLRVHSLSVSNDIKRSVGDREVFKRGYRHLKIKGGQEE
jgi:P4 family phage/plasmid primase-like protien